MDIDIVNNILKVNKNNNKFQMPKEYCRIGEMNNHSTNECYYNKRNKNKNNKNNKKANHYPKKTFRIHE